MSHPYREQINGGAPYPTGDDLLASSGFRYPAQQAVDQAPNAGQNRQEVPNQYQNQYQAAHDIGNAGTNTNQYQTHPSAGQNPSTIQVVQDNDIKIGNGFGNSTLKNSSNGGNAHGTTSPGAGAQEMGNSSNFPGGYEYQQNQPFPTSPKFSSTDLYNTSVNSIGQTAFGSPKFSSTNGQSIGFQNVIPPDSSKITSPNSVSLSASSSVTNLNLNNTLSIPKSNSQESKFSKSETNLSTPQRNYHSHNSSYGHSRSISSTSSFFYDRNADNASMIDFSQNLIQQYLGSNSPHLLPRIKTIELYRKNAKKSSDPSVIFQYAQYILQTALLLDADAGSSANSSTKNSPKSANNKRLSLRNPDSDLSDEGKLRRQLIKEAIHYLKKLSDKGYAEAQYLLADAYSSGAVGKVENREAFLLFVHAAKHGHIESAYRTSHCYEEGLGTGRDARKSVEFLKMAAAKNHPAAMYKLGIYSFYSRMGLPSNMDTKKMGIKWLTRASNIATELIAAAPYELGKIYFDGFEDIVIPDKKYALELYSQAAALGHIQSAAILGQMYETGETVPQDGNLSIHYYTQAALGGDTDAMLAMCAWYLVGCEPHLPKDDNEAFEWAKRAANCNLPRAQFALANFYEKGIGCIKDLKEAQTWYTRAAENGDVKSIERITDQKVVAQLKKKKITKKGSVGNSLNADAKDKDCVIM